VVQLYTHQQRSAAVQPIKKLRNFQRVNLQPGEVRHIEFALPINQLAYYDVRRHDFAVETGTFDVLVGSSSDDIRLKGILTIAGK